MPRVSTDTAALERRREHLLDAAAAVVSERGFARATIREIAARAGVADGTLYNYFADKEELLEGLLDRLAGAERTKMTFGAAPPTSVPDYLEAFLRHRIETLQEHRHLVRALLPELLVNERLRRRYAKQVLGPSQAAGERLLAALDAAGGLDRGTPEVSVRAVRAMVLGLVLLDLLGDEDAGSSDDVAPALAQLLLPGLVI